MAVEERTWRIGEVATSTGLTVRALHHYDQIGLVVPSARTSGGHRLYTDADLAVLCAYGRALDRRIQQLGRCCIDSTRLAIRLRPKITRGENARYVEYDRRLTDCGTNVGL